MSTSVIVGGVVGGTVVSGGALTVAQEANSRYRGYLSKRRHKAHSNLRDQREENIKEIVLKQSHRQQSQEELNALINQIKEEEKKILTFENVTNDENTKFMVVAGMTGDGKSTILNRLSGDRSKRGDGDGNKKDFFEAKNSQDSVTQVPKHKVLDIHGINSVIVDTPGYKDGEHKDDEHFNNLASYLYDCKGVDAFLLVMNGTKARFDGTIQEMLAEYSKYFGPKFWRHLIIIQTHIEAFAKEQYIEDKQADKLRQKMRDEIEDIDEECEIPIITIGFGEDYDQFCRDVMMEVVGISMENGKLDCKELQSPIKTLRERRKQLEDKIRDLDDEIRPIQQDIDDADDEIARLDKKIDNPEMYPLISNFRAKLYD